MTFRTVTGQSFSLDLEESSKVSHQRVVGPPASAHRLRCSDFYELSGPGRQREGAGNKGRCVPRGKSSIDLSGQSRSRDDACLLSRTANSGGQNRALSLHQVLKDDTTLAENKVSENGFMVIMVTKVSLLLLVHTCVDAVRMILTR